MLASKLSYARKGLPNNSCKTRITGWNCRKTVSRSNIVTGNMPCPTIRSFHSSKATERAATSGRHRGGSSTPPSKRPTAASAPSTGSRSSPARKHSGKFDTWLPDDSVAAARDLRVSIKGPLTTPVGGGIRSLNVALRQILDLYACVRPVKYYQGVPSPVKHPEKLDIVIFRENTEDVYAGVEFKQGSEEAARLISFLNDDLLKGGKKKIRD